MGRKWLGFLCAGTARILNRAITAALIFALCILVIPLKANATEISTPESVATTTAHVSWYGHRFQGKLMANGKPFNMYALTAASKTLPFGTRVILQNPRNRQRVTVTITDRGPFVRGRDFDVSWAAAHRLGILGRGVSTLEVVAE